MSPRAAVLLALWVCLGALPPSLAPRPGSAEQSGCFKVNNCQCIMKDGSGVINLEAMGDAGGFLGHLRPVAARDAAAEAEAELLLSFSPCQPFSQPEELTGGGCTGVAACVTVRSHRLSRYLSYGRHDGNLFLYNQTLRTLSVSYFADEQQPRTVVHYHCDPDLPSSIVRDQRLSAQEPLQIWVESPCACPNACTMGDLGLGTIFLIMLSLSAAAYFLLGSCALRPFRSSGGVQISPEQSVWCMICFLCTERRPARRRGADAAH